MLDGSQVSRFCYDTEGSSRYVAVVFQSDVRRRNRNLKHMERQKMIAKYA